MRFNAFGAVLALLLGIVAPVQAQTDEQADAARRFVESLQYQDGEVAVGAAQARLKLEPGFRFLGAQDARRVLEDFWGNPPDPSVLGMIVPATPPLDAPESWAVVVTYSGDGYVSDMDAAAIDYDALLSDMKEGTAEDNAQRRELGYGAVDLVGWAEPPHYDADSKKLYWAKELAFEGNDGHTVNYDIRVLGRHGYLSLNAVAAMNDLPAVRGGMQQILPMVEFDAGARYADFDSSRDKVAAYGLAALVGGGLAAKAGLFAKLGLLLAKFWKLFAIGGVLVVAALGKLFKKKEGGGR